MVPLVSILLSIFAMMSTLPGKLSCARILPLKHLCSLQGGRTLNGPQNQQVIFRLMLMAGATLFFG
jgi:hypothetical protein